MRRPPLGFWAPTSRRTTRAKTPAEVTETLTEVTKYVRKPTKKHARTVGAPLTIWAHQKNRAPMIIKDPSDSQSSSVTVLNTRASPTIRGLPNCKEPSDYQEPSQLSGPSEYQGPSNGPFKAWGP